MLVACGAADTESRGAAEGVDLSTDIKQYLSVTAAESESNAGPIMTTDRIPNVSRQHCSRPRRGGGENRLENGALAWQLGLLTY